MEALGTVASARTKDPKVAFSLSSSTCLRSLNGLAEEETLSDVSGWLKDLPCSNPKASKAQGFLAGWGWVVGFKACIAVVR